MVTMPAALFIIDKILICYFQQMHFHSVQTLYPSAWRGLNGKQQGHAGLAPPFSSAPHWATAVMGIIANRSMVEEQRLTIDPPSTLPRHSHFKAT